MEDLDTPNRDMIFDDRTGCASISMGPRVMHVYFDTSNLKHGFVVYSRGDLMYRSEPVYSSFRFARVAGKEKIAQLGNIREGIRVMPKNKNKRVI